MFMFDKKEIAKYPLKKCKSFGYTFSIFFLLIFIFFYLKFDNQYYSLLVVSSIFLLITLVRPQLLRIFSILWEKVGLIIGKIFSPLILILIYITTIVPINIILRIFSVDLLKKQINQNTKTYWIKRDRKNINFKKQF